MITAIDLTVEQLASSDRDELELLLTQLIGKPFLFFRVSYGDELTLHFGSPRPYPNPKLKGHTKGSFILGVRASIWFFQPRGRPMLLIGPDDVANIPPNRATKLDTKEIESGEYVKPGSLILRATVVQKATGFGLELNLSDDSMLLILPVSTKAEESDDDEVADWEVFTPYNRYLRVGPGNRWSYLDSSQKNP
jgi:hypothetical protein